MSVFGTITLILVITIVIVVAIFMVTSLTGAPYVPTLRHNLTQKLHQLHPLNSKDFLIDLGSGDGIILDIAAKSGAHALGLELNPILALISKLRFRRQPRITVKCRNFYHYTFPPETTVIYAFAVSMHIEPIHRKIQREANRLHKPLYFISNAFDLAHVKPIKKVSSFYLYRIEPQSKGKD